MYKKLLFEELDKLDNLMNEYLKEYSKVSKKWVIIFLMLYIDKMSDKDIIRLLKGKN